MDDNTLPRQQQRRQPGALGGAAVMNGIVWSRDGTNVPELHQRATGGFRGRADDADRVPAGAEASLDVGYYEEAGLVAEGSARRSGPVISGAPIWMWGKIWRSVWSRWATPSTFIRWSFRS